jgi:hypothetical protein
VFTGVTDAALTGDSGDVFGSTSCWCLLCVCIRTEFVLMACFMSLAVK